ncbi:hypothetical protein YC2023_063297 [Brassica napus]
MYPLTTSASLSDRTTKNEKTPTPVTSLRRRQARQNDKIESEEERLLKLHSSFYLYLCLDT